jgi:hypothetical protein
MIFEPGKKNIYFSTYPPPTLIHLSQCVETRSIEVFCLLSQAHLHRRFNLLVISEIFATKVEVFYATNTSHRKQNTFIDEYPFHWVLLLAKKKRTTEPALQYWNFQARSPFLILKPASEHAHARLLPRLSWSWTVLLPSDTHRKPLTFITAVLLPFVTYLLTLPVTRLGMCA